MKILLSNILLATIIFVSNVNLSIASNQAHNLNKRIEAIREKHIEIFELMEKAFEEGDLDKLTELAKSLDQVLAKHPSELDNSISEFYSVLSNGDIANAKKLGYALIESSKTSYTQKAYIHNALGDYYMQKNDLDNALVEYKKIVELPVNKNSISN